MPTYYTILTDAGQALLAEAISSGVPVVLTQFAVGDGNGAPVTPDASMTALVNEVYRSSISSLSTNPEQPNAMVAQLVIPKESGGYTVREVAVFTEDGTMFSIGNYPDQPKPPTDSGYAVKLDMRYVLVVSDTSAITVVIEPGDYLTQEEADGRYVNVTGDTMTGPLVMGAELRTQAGFIRQSGMPYGDVNFSCMTQSQGPDGVTRWNHGAFQNKWTISAYDAAGAWKGDMLFVHDDGTGTTINGNANAVWDVTAGNSVLAAVSVYSGGGQSEFRADGNILGPTWGGNLHTYITNMSVGDVALGAEIAIVRNVGDDEWWQFHAPVGNNVTGLQTSAFDHSDTIETAYAKPIKKFIGGAWWGIGEVALAASVAITKDYHAAEMPERGIQKSFNFTPFRHEKTPLRCVDLIDDNGYLWSDVQKALTGSVFISYDEAGVICSITEIAAALHVDGLSVAGLDALPEGCSIDGTWKFDGETVYQDVEIVNAKTIKSNATKINTEKRRATSEIIFLQILSATGNASKKQTQTLTLWTDYLVQLSKITDLINPDWPPSPI